TMATREWFAWEWLADLAMAFQHRHWGLAGVVGGAVLILLASYDAMYRMMIRQRADPIVAFVTTIFVALTGIVHWLARPHLVSIFLMVFWLAAVEDFRRNRSRWIYFLPPGIALWANLHGAFVSTFPMLAAYAIGEWAEFAARGEWRNEKLRRVLRVYGIVGLL